MSNINLEGKNTTNNVLTHKGGKVFHRRNKVKAALALTSTAAGVGGGIGIAYALFHKQEVNSSFSAYSVGLLQINKDASPSYLKIDSINNVIIPESGEKANIEGLPNGIQGEWSNDNKILLKGIPSASNQPGNYQITIVIGTTSATSSISLIDEETPPYVEAYCDDSLQVGQYSEVEIVINTYGDVDIPSDGEDVDIDGLPENIEATWNENGNITLSGTPIADSQGTWIVLINVNDEVSTTTSIVVEPAEPIPTPTKYIQPIVCGSAKAGIVSNVLIEIDSSNVNFPADGTDARENIDYGLNITSATWNTNGSGTKVIELEINEDVADTYFITIHVDGVFAYTSITIIPVTYTYSIEPVTFLTNTNQVTFTANKYENGQQVSTTGEITIEIADNARINKYLTTFADGSTNTFDVNWVQTNNYFNLSDGTQIEIHNPNGLMVFGGSTYASNRLNNTTYTSAAISDVSLITEIHIKPDQTITAAPDNYGRNLCYGMTNLIVADILLPQTIESVGNDFCHSLLQSCTNLETLPANFNLPQKITSCGDYFGYLFFEKCYKLKSLPEGFNFPPNITTVGQSFVRCFFEECQALESLPDGFNFPQGITVAGGESFARSIFWNNYALKEFPAGFNLPQEMITANTNFCRYFIHGLTSLKTLPDGFNIPPKITSIGGSFCLRFIEDCPAFEKLPDGFNIPAGITNVSSGYFLSNMFVNASSLKTLPSGFKLPTGITGSPGEYFCSGMFSGCSSLEKLPKGFEIPTFTASSTGRFCAWMFQNCSSLQVDTTETELIKSPFTSGSSTEYAYQMFYGATNILNQYTGIPSSTGTPSYDLFNTGFKIARSD